MPCYKKTAYWVMLTTVYNYDDVRARKYIII